MSNISLDFAAVASLQWLGLMPTMFETLRMPIRQHRTSTTLSDFDDYHLRDIGLTRGDLMDGPLSGAEPIQH
jgi:hypothetical protein